MARQLRMENEGVFYHVTARGSTRLPSILMHRAAPMSRPLESQSGTTTVALLRLLLYAKNSSWITKVCTTP